jgi:hypothetical protein
MIGSADPIIGPRRSDKMRRTESVDIAFPKEKCLITVPACHRIDLLQ